MINYILDDITRNRKKYLIFLIQMIAVFYLLNLVVPVMKQWITFEQSYHRMEEKYWITNQIVYTGAHDQSRKFADLKQYIEEKYSDRYFSYSSGIRMYQKVRNEEAVAVSAYGERGISYLTCTVYTQDFFEWKCSDGRLLEKQDYNSDSEYLPVVIGATWGESYRVGEIIDGQYQVVGILEKGENYLSVELGENVSLDTYLITPMDQREDPYSDIYMSCINIVSKDSGIRKDIMAKAEELSFSKKDFCFQSVYGIFLDTVSGLKEMMVMTFSVAFGLTAMAAISLVAMLMQLVERRKREFAIHLLCGGTKKNLYLRVLLQVFMVIMTACILVGVIFRNVGNMVILAVVSLGISMLIVLKPFIYIQRHPVADMVRRIE